MKRPSALRLYKLLLKLYPRSHRRRFEAEMLRCFEQLILEPMYQGPRGRITLWLHVVSDVATNATLLRLSRRKRRRIQCPRRDHMLESIWRELVFGARKLLRRPSFATVAIVTLAVGIGANVLVFTVVHATLLNPLPYPEPHRVVSVWPDHWFTRGELAYVQAHAETLEVAGALTDSLVYIGSEEPLQLDGLHVSWSYFDVFQVPPLLGRTFEKGEADVSTVVLGYGLWQRLFGGERAILGETMTLDDRPFQIIGVMPKRFASLPLGGELWIPMEMNPQEGRYEGTNEIQAIARLAEHASPDQAEEEFQRILESRLREFGHLYSTDFGKDAALVPLHEAVTGDLRAALLVLQVAVLFVLLMACTNVANIALAGASTRSGELAIRSALGASRWQIVRQLTAESVVLAALGTVAGLSAALWCLPFLIEALPFEKPDWLEIGMGANALLFTVALAFLSILCFGVFPAFLTARENLHPNLRRGTSARGSERLRGVLVASEMALALVLVAGAGLMIKSFWTVLQVDLGFTTDRIVTMRVHPSPAKYREPEQSRIFYREVLERIRALPDVADAGLARRLPLQGAWFTALHVEGLPSTNDRGHSVQWTPADPGYFRTLGLKLVDGRVFDGLERADSQSVALINETFAEGFWPDESPIDRRVRFVDSEDEWITIVGVLENVKQNGPQGFAFPMIYRPYEQSPVRSMRIVAKTSGDPLNASASIRRVIWDVDPTVPISDVASMDQILSDSLAQPRLPVLGLVIFATIALILGTGGLYGVVSYLASQRTYDIGVLFALGAQRRQVLRNVMSQGMKPVLIGLLLGLGGSLALSRFIASLLYEVSPTDPTVLACVTAVLVLAALLACYLPARRASRIDPTEALRFE